VTFREKIYTLREKTSGSVTHYFISFKDGKAIHHEVEVSHTVYQEFQRFVRINRNLQAFDERHREYSELSDETLNSRARHTPKGVEENIVDMERSDILRQAIADLPEIQRRRFVLYYEYELTFRKIGEIEGCTATSVKRSVDIAKEKIQKKLKNF